MARANGREKRLSWIKFYTRDWRADAPLRMCSYAARGLWADLITLMAESPAFGFLLVEGIAPTARQLAGLLGGTEKEIVKLLAELGAANVYSITGQPMPEDVAALVPAWMPAGVMVSRRMVRDKARADRDHRNGKGGGNPNLTTTDNPSDNPPDNPGVNPPPNPQRSEARVQMIPEGAHSGRPSMESPPSSSARGSLEGSAHDTPQDTETMIRILTGRLRHAS